MNIRARITLALGILFMPKSWLREVVTKVASDPEDQHGIKAWTSYSIRDGKLKISRSLPQAVRDRIRQEVGAR